jgi:hypothetical protein
MEIDMKQMELENLKRKAMMSQPTPVGQNLTPSQPSQPPPTPQPKPAAKTNFTPMNMPMTPAFLQNLKAAVLAASTAGR